MGGEEGEPKNEAIHSLQLTYLFKTQKIDLLLDNISSFFLIFDCFLGGTTVVSWWRTGINWICGIEKHPERPEITDAEKEDLERKATSLEERGDPQTAVRHQRCRTDLVRGLLLDFLRLVFVYKNCIYHLIGAWRPPK